MVQRLTALGISEIGLYYPSRDEQAPKLERIARDLIPELKAGHASARGRLGACRGTAPQHARGQARMSDTFVSIFLLTAAVGSGLIGGLFFAFSTFIMRAFDRLPATQAIAGMQAINVTIINPVFFIAFFGTALVAAALAAIAVVDGTAAARVPILVGAAAYLLGPILVTVACNVPLNNMLAAVEPGDADPAGAWRRYRGRWTAWNHVRTLASLAAAAAFAAAMGA